MKPHHILPALVVIFATASSAHAQLLGIQFQGGGTALSSDQTAGLPALAQDNFNVVTGQTGTDVALVYSTGSGVGAPTLTFSTDDNYATGTGTATANDTLLSGKIDTATSGIGSFTLNGVAAGTYDLIVYTENNAGAGIGTYTVGSTSYEIQDESGTFDGTFIRGTTGPGATTPDVANYVEFDNIVVGAGGGSVTLTAKNTDGYYSDAVNGLQLAAVSTPEPSSWALLGAGLAGLFFAVRRRTA